MTVLTPARRVATLDEIEQAGDYCLQGTAGTDGAQVFFLLPIHQGKDKFDRVTRGSGLHGVTSPPWMFRECADGSLEIRDSIACGRADPEGEYWHGHLDEGNTWRQE